MDEFGVARLRKTVTRAAASLPSLILWALGPKEGQGGMLLAAAGIATLLSVAAGLRGLVQLRSWGWMLVDRRGRGALAAGRVGRRDRAGDAVPDDVVPDFGFICRRECPGRGAAAAGALLTLAALPFARPALRFLRSR